MANDREALLLQLSMDVRSIQKSIDKANGVTDSGFNRMEKRADGAARAIERSFGNVKLPKSLVKELNSFGADLGTGLMSASRTAQVALAGVSAYAIKVAADAQDINSAFTETFGNLAVQGEAAAAKIADDFSRSVVDVKSNMNTLQQVLKGLGLESEEAFKATQALAARSIDLASNKNISDARAAQAILSGLTGETDALKGLGVVITETSTKNELLRMGFKGSADQASEAAKTVARLNQILAKTAFAQGDVARTSDGANNKLKALEAEAKNAAVALGNQLLPAFIKVAKAATGALTAFNEMPTGLQIASLAILGFVAAGGPIAGLLANLAKVIDLAKKTRLALATVTGASAAAGAAGAGGAALAAGAGTVAAVGVAVGGTLSLSGDTPRATAQSILNARLQDEIQARKKIAEYEAKSGEAAARKVKFWQGVLASNQEEIRTIRARERAERISANRAGQRKKAAEAPEAAPNAAVVGGFSLTPDQKAGGGGKRVKATVVSGPRGRPIDPGSLLIVDEASIFDLVNSLSGAPIAASSANADGRGLSPTGDQTDFQTAEERIAIPEAALRELQDTTYDRTYYGIRGGLEAGAREGAAGLAQYIGDAVQSKLLDVLADMATSFVINSGKSLFSKGGAVASLFGFADGGNPPVGRPYLVGENGPEIRIDRSPSTILPNSLVQAMQGGIPARAAPVVQQFFPNFSGAVMTEDLMQQFKAYADRTAGHAAMRGAQGGAALARQQAQRSATNRLGVR